MPIKVTTDGGGDGKWSGLTGNPSDNANVTTKGEELLGTVDAAAVRAAAGVEIGTDVQAYSATLAAIEEPFTTALKNKLDGIEVAATANSTDEALRDRSTHTGTQLLATISDAGTAAAEDVGAFLRPGVSATLNAGFSHGFYDLGTITGSTVTPDVANGNMQRMVNDGPVTLATMNGDGQSILIHITNGPNAGAIDYSAWDQVLFPEVLDTVQGHRFVANCVTTYNGASLLQFMPFDTPAPDGLGGDAPADGSVYGRQDGGWEEVTAAGTSYDNSASNLAATDVKAALDELEAEKTGEAPIDGNAYVRVDGTWQQDSQATPVIPVRDEGAQITGSLESLDFVGSGITAADDGSGNVTVTADGGTAAGTTYDNSASGLTATDAKAALDELAARTGAPITAVIAGTDAGAEIKAATDYVEGTDNIETVVASALADGYRSLLFVGTCTATAAVDITVSGAVDLWFAPGASLAGDLTISTSGARVKLDQLPTLTVSDTNHRLVPGRPGMRHPALPTSGAITVNTAFEAADVALTGDVTELAFAGDGSILLDIDRGATPYGITWASDVTDAGGAPAERYYGAMVSRSPRRAGYVVGKAWDLAS
jgi:hypothetical protein